MSARRVGLGWLTLALWSAAVCPALPATRPADHVVVISVDGLVPEYARGTGGRLASMPNLAALRDAGTAAEAVVGVYPSLTYPSHTTIVTGVRPAAHGIYGNTAFEPDGGSELWLFEARAIRARTLWQAAREAGLTTAGVSWPVTVGAAIDFLFPETAQSPREGTWLDLARRESTAGLIDAVVEELGGFAPDGNRDPRARDRFATAAARVILRDHAPGLLLVHLVQTDYAQHRYGRGSDQADEAFRNADAHIGEIVAAVEAAGLRKSTAFVVTGDHGFRNVERALQPNQALREAGLLEADAEGHITSWRAQAHRGAIRLADPGNQATAERVLTLFRDLARAHPDMLQVIERPELDRREADPDAFLFVEPKGGYALSAGFEAASVSVPASGRGSHGYLPEAPDMWTGLVLSGAGVAPGAELGVVEMVDVAPTIARLLGLAMDGAEGHALVTALVASTARED